jgi:Mg-chelatase subunit ChlD
LALALVCAALAAVIPGDAEGAVGQPLRVVLLGDSYSAGNGADNYWGPEGCYRSTENWAEQYLDTIRPSRPVTFVNRACSGGVLDDFTQPNEMGDDLHSLLMPADVTSTSDPRIMPAIESAGACDTSYPGDEAYDIDVIAATPNTFGGTTVTYSCTRYLEPQWDAVGEDTDLVMFSIGGNDVEFSSIIENCFAVVLRDVGTCREKIESAQEEIVEVGTRTESFLRALKLRMRPDAKIVLKSYPYLEKNPDYTLSNLLPWPFDDSYAVGSEIRQLGDLGDQAQQAAVDAVNAEGGAQAIFVDEIKPHFAGHEPDGRVCCENEDRWINEFDGFTRMEWYHYNGTGHTEVARVLAGYGDFGTSSSPTSNAGVDIAFVIDTTGSMGSAINSVKAAATQLVNTVTAQTSAARFALVDYRDFPVRTGTPTDYPAKLDQDFTSDAATINGAIQSLVLGNGGDLPETMYSGLATAFDLTWRPGVKKMAIVLADAPPLSPEPFTGLTGLDIVLRSLAIDPVEVHVVDVRSAMTSELTEVVERTNGGVYRTTPSQAATQIAAAIDVSLQRPYAWAGGPYVGAVGKTHTLDGRGSYGIAGEIVSYEWDVDSDGIYDYSGASPTATHTYTAPFDGLVTLRVTDSTGRVGLSTTVGHASVDGDEIPAAEDNCPAATNPGQEDWDGDGVGDVCDETHGLPHVGEGKPGVVDNGDVRDPDGDSTPGSVTTFREPHFNVASTIESAEDRADYLGVQHPGGRLQVQLVGLHADYDLALTDLAGNVLERSAEDGKRSEKVRATLAAGRYLIAVLPKEGEFDAKHEYHVNANVLG